EKVSRGRTLPVWKEDGPHLPGPPVRRQPFRAQESVAARSKRVECRLHMDAFASLDATAQADLVRRKEVKPLELVDAAIARIERLNPKLNAVIAHWFDEARELARGPLPEGPFTGVPFLLKDLISAYAGKKLTSGSRFFADLVVPH